MRLWLSERERRPDPPPARADARKALAAGTAAWLVVLGGALVLRGQLDAAAVALIVPTAAIGALLGVAGLVVVQTMRHRAARGAGERDASAPEDPAA